MTASFKFDVLAEDFFYWEVIMIELEFYITGSFSQHHWWWLPFCVTCTGAGRDAFGSLLTFSARISCVFSSRSEEIIEFSWVDFLCSIDGIGNSWLCLMEVLMRCHDLTFLMNSFTASHLCITYRTTPVGCDSHRPLECIWKMQVLNKFILSMDRRWGNDEVLWLRRFNSHNVLW